MRKGSILGQKTFKAAMATAVATGTLVSALPASVLGVSAATTSFSDVKPSHFYYDAVLKMAAKGIISGYSDGTFRPSQDITRGQAAKIMTNALGLDTKNVKDPGFKDVSKSYPFYGEIAALVNAGIIKGYTDDTFKPTESLTRAQMAQYLVLGFELEQENLPKLPFNDVNAKSAHTKYIQALVASKITTGKTATTFEPNAKLTRGEASAFIHRAGQATQAKEVTILDITDKEVKLTTGTYPLTDELKKMLNVANIPVLKGAVVKYTVANNQITGISSIELKANGTAANNLTLDGNSGILPGTLIISGDYITVKNVTIIKDLHINKAVQNSFKTEGVTVVGKTVISDETAKDVKAAATVSTNISFHNTILNTVELSKVGSTFELTGASTAKTVNVNANTHLKADASITLPEVSLKAGANDVTLDANVSKLNIDSENTKVTLGANTKVGDITLPNGKELKDIIKNYEQVRANIENVGGKPNPDAKPVTPPPSSGGGNNGGDTDKNFKLSLMHTNDTHAKVETAPQRITAIKQQREKNPNAVLVDAGDVFSGTLYFNQYKGLADLAFMNLAKYDVMTFGNHEFDLGSEGHHEALATFIKGAHFPFVSANADFSKDENLQGLFSDLVSSEPENGKIYNGIVKEIEGEKVGFFGLTTAETKGLSSPGQVTFTDYMEEAEKAVKAFEDMDVNKIVAVSHIGYDDNPAVDNDLMLAAKVAGIDVIIGGHSHTKLSAPVVVDKDETGAAKDKTIIVQASSQGDFLGTLDVEFDKNGKVVSETGALIEVGKLAKDPEAMSLLEEYKPAVDKIAEEEIGVSAEVALENPRTNGDNTKPSVRKNETILGNLITDGMLAKAKSLNPEVIMAFQNGGGIRASIDAGPITVGEVISVLPFGNTLSTLEMTGAQLKEVFETSVGVYPLENGGFLHVAGAKIEFDSSKPKGERVVSISYENDGTYTEVTDAEVYTIATNYFTAQGGDNYEVFKKIYEAGKVKDLGLSDWENFADHLKTLDAVPTEIEGRIIDVAGKEVDPEIIVDPGKTPDPVTTTEPPLYNSNSDKLAVSQIARYDSGQGETGAEILAYDAATNNGFVTNGAVGGFDILDFTDVKSGEFKQLDSTKRVVIEDYGIPGVKNITSIASNPTQDLIAIAAYSEKTDPGYIIFATKDGKYVKHVEVGALPDMVTFTPDGKKAIVANEGEPNKDTTIDPAGSISVIDSQTLTTTTLNFTEEMLDDKVRTSYKGASILEQLEPEYVTVSDDSKTAYVTLQENNAIATVNLETNTILHVKGLGVIDHSVEGNEMDANKDDKKAGILKQPILTFHMPDAVDTFTVADKTYIITPNEGDSRDYADDGGYSEVEAVGKLKLPVKLNAANYKNYTQEELDAFDISSLASYKITTENGLNEAGTEYEALYGYGGRSFSIFDAETMEQVYDSGSEFEKIIAEKTPQYFNTNSDEIKIDNRSDDKGPEPETAVVGEIDGTTYGFIALERYSGIIVYDLTDVNAPEFVTLISSRDFSKDVAGDVSPEGLQFIPASESPTGKALLAATHEVSGTIAVYEFGASTETVGADDFSGTVEAPKIYEGNVTVSITDAAKLENAIVKGNLTITGTPTEAFSMKNITVEGNLDATKFEGDILEFDGITVSGEINF